MLLNRLHDERSWRLLGLVLAALTAATPTRLVAGERYIDRAVFPRGYSILTSDRLMFPQNLNDWPLKLGRQRQLFVDDYLIASMSGLRREYHQPIKHPANPVMVAEPPGESPWLCLGTVLRNKADGRFRMWYSDRFMRMMYAESDDGIHWHRPQLGLIEREGSRANNLIIDHGYMIGMVHDPAPGAEGYVAIVSHGIPRVAEPGFFVYRSADGLRWEGDLRRPVLTCTENPRLFSSVGIGDTSNFRYDPLLGRYVVDAKFNLYLPDEMMKELGMVVEAGKNRIRSRAFLESEDLIHWTSPRFLMFPDDRDEPDSQIYGHIGFVYESMWLGVVRVLHIERAGWKQTEVELSYSRDGRHWCRPPVRRPFIPLGGPDEWDPDYTDVDFNGPLTVGDELWFYYRGSRNNERDRTDHYTMAVGLARLRRDGFASLNAGKEAGRVTTRPLTFSGRSLFVNAEVQPGGWVKAAVLTRRSEPIAGYDLEASVPLATDTTAGRMTWHGADQMPASGDDHVRLRFELKDAKLYSFWIE